MSRVRGQESSVTASVPGSPLTATSKRSDGLRPGQELVLSSCRSIYVQVSGLISRCILSFTIPLIPHHEETGQFACLLTRALTTQ